MPYCFLALLVVTTYLLLMEVTPRKVSISNLDKVIHAGLFLALSTAAYWAFPRKYAAAFWGLAVYGALTEGLQHWLTVTRHASFMDLVANLTGIVLCVLIISLLRREPLTKDER